MPSLLGDCPYCLIYWQPSPAHVVLPDFTQRGRLRSLTIWDRQDAVSRSRNGCLRKPLNYHRASPILALRIPAYATLLLQCARIRFPHRQPLLSTFGKADCYLVRLSGLSTPLSQIPVL